MTDFIQTHVYYLHSCAKSGPMSFRVCIACHGFRVYPYVGFMTGQRYQCQDCSEMMVIPLEFENEADYKEYLEIISEGK